jgi:hypothetical protein
MAIGSQGVSCVGIVGNSAGDSEPAAWSDEVDDCNSSEAKLAKAAKAGKVRKSAAILGGLMKCLYVALGLVKTLSLFKPFWRALERIFICPWLYFNHWG